LQQQNALVDAVPTGPVRDPVSDLEKFMEYPIILRTDILQGGLEMTTDSPKPERMKWLGSNLTLGFLVTVMSILTAVANYSTYVVGGTAADYEKQGDRLLADANTSYVSASQFIIVDYTMYDNYRVNEGVDDFAAEYYQSQFSDSLQASVDRGDPFDDQYYTEMDANADSLLEEAFAMLDQASSAAEREAGYQLAMLFAALGLAFAAYASLLEEANRLRKVFALMSLSMMVLSIAQFVLVSAG
jgi:hypothetical protein